MTGFLLLNAPSIKEIPLTSRMRNIRMQRDITEFQSAGATFPYIDSSFRKIFYCWILLGHHNQSTAPLDIWSSYTHFFSNYEYYIQFLTYERRYWKYSWTIFVLPSMSVRLRTFQSWKINKNCVSTFIHMLWNDTRSVHLSNKNKHPLVSQQRQDPHFSR